MSEGGKDDSPDDFFAAEFGSGDLAGRLWRGGLRAGPAGYALERSGRMLASAVSEGLDVRVTEDAAAALADAIETCWNDVARMRRACVALNADASAISLVKLFLSVDALQPALVRCVVNKISEFGEDTNVDRDLAPLLLAQLKWLNFVVDAPALCENLLAIVPVVSPTMQRSIIEGLPEILDDSSRDEAVSALVDILNESPSMMGSIVDALGALGVDDARLEDVNGAILATLAAANRDMLPASLRYLIRTCPQPLLVPTVSALRTTLALPGLGPGPGRLCIDAVRAGFRLSKTVAEQVIKILRKIDKPSDHKPADLWIIVALLDSPAHRKAAETLWRKKAASEMLSSTLIDAALAPFADAFGSLTHRLIGIASIAVKAPELAARRTGVNLYAKLFRLFEYGNTRRNVVSALLEHTGTRRPLEIDAALEALVLIARDGEAERLLLPHSATVQGLLDFLELYSDSQLRQIWTLLALLCRSSNAKSIRARLRRQAAQLKDLEEEEDEDEDMDGDDAGESELAMLEILVRKELTHADVFYRRIGVLGACTMIKVLGSQVQHGMLGMLLDAGKSKPFSQALAFDELAQVLSDGEPTSKDMISSISVTIASSFEEKYIADAVAREDDVNEDENALGSELYANLDGPDSDLCIPVMRIIRAQPNTSSARDALRAMVPNLRLLCLLTAAQHDGSLEEIDAVIGAPLRIPSSSAVLRFSSLSFADQQRILLAFFVAHGWMVELVNGFASQQSSELRAKCVLRLANLLELTDRISSCTGQMPLWTETLFDAYHGMTSLSNSHKGNEMINMGGGRAAQKKGRHAGKLVNENGVGTGETAGPVSSTRKVSFEWQRYARKLTPAALSLIRTTTPIPWTFTEAESEMQRATGGSSDETVELGVESLQYLLSQLAMHLDSLVGSSVLRKGSLGATLLKSSGTGGIGCLTAACATTAAPVAAYQQLRFALLSLGPQLSRCLERCLFDGEDYAHLSDDDTTIAAFQQCAVLCLKCLAGALNSTILSDASAQDLLFDFLASIRFDGNAPIESSDPLSTSDIYVAAKTAFAQLRAKLGAIFDTMNNADSDTDDDDGNNARNGKGGGELVVGLGRLSLEGCTAFLATLDAVFAYCSEKDQDLLGTRLSDAAGSLLERPWDADTLRSRKTLKLLPGIVRIHVQWAPDSFQTVEELRGRIVTFFEQQKKLQMATVDTQESAEKGRYKKSRLGQSDGVVGQVTAWGSLTPPSSNVYCIALYQQYMSLFKLFHPSSYENSRDALKRMTLFMSGSIALYSLARDNEKVLGPAMRAGRVMVDTFLKTCLPFLKDKFRMERTAVLDLFKVQQKSTRLLQLFCAHCKKLRDTSLTSLVPPLRKSLELLLYRVKEVILSNNEKSAFSLANLKHRDIHGTVIGSQDQFKSDSESEEVSDEEADVDEDEEDEIQAEPTSRSKKSNRRKNTAARVLKTQIRPRERPKFSQSKKGLLQDTVSDDDDEDDKPIAPRMRNAKSGAAKRSKKPKATTDADSDDEYASEVASLLQTGGALRTAEAARTKAVATATEDLLIDSQRDVDDRNLNVELPSRHDDDDLEEEEEEEDDGSSDAIRRPKKRPRSVKPSARAKRRKAQRRSVFLDDEAEGDGYEDSQEEEDDLDGFIIGDDEDNGDED